MKNLIVLAIGVAVLQMVAKYYKINSLEDIKNFVPGLKNFVPDLKNVVPKVKEMVYS
ncbi:MAG: hypothetical protein K0S26_2957 [Bacteroidota bacterium]|jgi:hypothetical protein|nr:hypothetical protein [Bacteroidota bacterium]